MRRSKMQINWFDLIQNSKMNFQISFYQFFSYYLKYNNIVKNDTLYAWFIGKKIYSIRPGLYNLKYKYNKDKPFTIREYPIYTFLKNEDVEIYSNDAIDIIKKYNNDINNFLFLDPPYLELCNDFYSSKYNVNIYEWIYYNNIPYHNATYCLILEKMWIIDLLFKNMYKIEYDKIYQKSKKKTIHYLIFNKNINNDTINNDTTTIISRKAGVHYNI
jgi:16S rRNA G966 N2-methylase RsmD